MWPNPQFPADFVTFTEEIFNGKLHFLCSVLYFIQKPAANQITSFYMKYATGLMKWVMKLDQDLKDYLDQNKVHAHDDMPIRIIEIRRLSIIKPLHLLFNNFVKQGDLQYLQRISCFRRYTGFQTLLLKCPNTEFLWAVFSRIWTDYGNLLQISVFSTNTKK